MSLFIVGRRGDFKSLGYTVLYFLTGMLSLQSLKAINKKDKYERIMHKKMTTSVETIYGGFPDEFVIYLTYVKNLKFMSNLTTIFC
jgi:hypothetical protein